MKPMARSVAKKYPKGHGDAGGYSDIGHSTYSTPRSRRPPLSPKRAMPPASRFSPPPPARHHQCRVGLEETKDAAALPPPFDHPANFASLRYSSRRFSHLPGLHFFEYLPPRASISIASAVVFLGPGAAKRVRMIHRGTIFDMHPQHSKDITTSH